MLVAVVEPGEPQVDPAHREVLVAVETVPGALDLRQVVPILEVVVEPQDQQIYHP
jgi:hypothetical protein